MELCWQLRDTNLLGRIATFVDNDEAFVVGITASPENRIETLEEGGMDYNEMVVLYQTRNKSKIRRLKQDLGQHLDGYDDPRGRGRVTGPPFYVYLCRYADA